MQSLRKKIAQELPFILSVPALWWQVIFLYIPLGIIGYTAFSGAGHDSLSHFGSLLDYAHIKIVARSLILASSAALITLLLSYPVVYYIVFHQRAYKRQLLILLMLPFWTNFLVLAYSWFFLLERHGLINTILLRLGIIHEPLALVYTMGAALVVMSYCYLPFMIMPLYTTLEKLDNRLLEASADLGANSWQTFMRVTLPLSLPGIKTGLLLVFVPAFGEFAVPTLLGGSKFLVVGSLISYYFFVARNKSVGAAFTIFAGTILMILLYSVQKGIALCCLVGKRRRL